MNVLLVGGFLGSGKTSFILKLAHHLIEDLGIGNIVILENEIGEISVDDKLMKGAGYQVRGLFSGCVCCTLAGELPGAIRQIELEINPDWVIMEATGLAFPYMIRKNLRDALGKECKVVCLTDAQRWKRLFAAMEQLLCDQMQGADVVLVNKADLVEQETIDRVTADIRSMNASAEIVPCCASEAIPIALIDRILSEEG